MDQVRKKILRVCIEIDLHKPISWGQTINIQGNRFWVSLTYEKLLRIYFRFCCRQIVHKQGVCEGDDVHKQGETTTTPLTIDAKPSSYAMLVAALKNFSAQTSLLDHAHHTIRDHTHHFAFALWCVFYKRTKLTINIIFLNKNVYWSLKN